MRDRLPPCAGWWWGLVLLTIVRLVLAAGIPLPPDEAYYRIWAPAPAGADPAHTSTVAVRARRRMSCVGGTAVGVRGMGPVSTGVAPALTG